MILTLPGSLPLVSPSRYSSNLFLISAGVAGGQNHLVGIDQRGQRYASSLGFEPEGLRREILHAMVFLDQRGAVDHLAVVMFFWSHCTRSRRKFDAF